MDKYRFCSPKGSSKPKEANCSLEIKPPHLPHRLGKENHQNLSEIKPAVGKAGEVGEEEL